MKKRDRDRKHSREAFFPLGKAINKEVHHSFETHLDNLVASTWLLRKMEPGIVASKWVISLQLWSSENVIHRKEGKAK